MKTVREKIIERIVTQLESIAVHNGYDNEIGPGNVYRQESIFEKGKTPSAVIWELSESRERNRYGGTVRLLTLRIECLVAVPENKHPATIANELLGDLEKSMIMGNLTLDELIEDIQDVAAEILVPSPNRRIEGREVIYLPIDRQMAGAAVDFEITYTTEWGDPYTQ